MEMRRIGRNMHQLIIFMENVTPLVLMRFTALFRSPPFSYKEVFPTGRTSRSNHGDDSDESDKEWNQLQGVCVEKNRILRSASLPCYKEEQVAP